MTDDNGHAAPIKDEVVACPVCDGVGHVYGLTCYRCASPASPPKPKQQLFGSQVGRE
jgi:hypothetical protein